MTNLGNQSSDELLPAMAGQRLARGVSRLLVSLGHAPLCEFVPKPKLRVDVISVAPSGEIWEVECKSCLADFRSDHKWQHYLEYCDRYFWAVGGDFPQDVLPEGSGLIQADSWGAELVRMGPECRLAPARRARVLRDVARILTLRLLAVRDPLGVSGAAF